MKLTLKILMLAVVFTTLTSCGSSNNDQGAGFTLIGFNAQDEDNICQEDVFVQGYLQTLSLDVLTGSVEPLLTAIPGCLNIQNNLSRVGIRVDRVFLDYNIPGASLQPPSTSVSVGQILGPGPASEGSAAPPDSSLPPGFRNISNLATMGVILVPTDIIDYLNLNRADFPELPFIMEVSVRASGVTTAGTRLETNVATIFIQFVPDVRISPSADGDGTGAANSDESSTGEVSADEEFLDNDTQ